MVHSKDRHSSLPESAAHLRTSTRQSIWEPSSTHVETNQLTKDPRSSVSALRAFRLTENAPKPYHAIYLVHQLEHSEAEMGLTSTKQTFQFFPGGSPQTPGLAALEVVYMQSLEVLTSELLPAGWGVQGAASLVILS